MGRRRAYVDPAVETKVLEEFDAYCLRKTKPVPEGTIRIADLIADETEIPIAEVRKVLRNRDLRELEREWIKGCDAVKSGKDIDWAALFPRAYKTFLEALYLDTPIGADQKWALSKIFDNVKKTTENNAKGEPEFPT